MTGDKTLGLARFPDLPLISSLNVAPPKVLGELRWAYAIGDTIP